jgi:hypothetical protein
MIEKLRRNNLYDLMDFVSETKDNFEDFYISLGRERKQLNSYQNIKFYFDRCLKHGEFGLGNLKQGYLITWGFFDKSERKYVKVLAKNPKAIRNLLTIFLFNYGQFTWFIRCKINNPLNRLAQERGFSFYGGRGSEILLIRKGIPIRPLLIDKDDRE